MKATVKGLNSFAVHPQIKSKFHSEECHKLMNQGTTPAVEGSPAPSGPSMSSGSDFEQGQ